MYIAGLKWGWGYSRDNRGDTYLRPANEKKLEPRPKSYLILSKPLAIA